MKKAILISIRPNWVAKILNGEKTIEIRKTMPKCDLPINVYIYCTKDRKYANLINRGGFLTGMVVAKFTLNKVEKINSYFEPEQWYMTRQLCGRKLLEKSCLSFSKLDDYLFGGDGYAWHIENLEIFDKPKELREFNSIKGFTTCEHCLFDIKTCNCEHCNSLTRAPQSWCYIEV